MNNKVTGTMFCMIAAILTAARYLSAMIFMSSTSCDEPAFSAGMEYVTPLKYLSLIALVIGIVFLGYGIIQDIRKGKQS